MLFGLKFKTLTRSSEFALLEPAGFNSIRPNYYDSPNLRKFFEMC